MREAVHFWGATFLRDPRGQKELKGVGMTQSHLPLLRHRPGF